MLARSASDYDAKTGKRADPVRRTPSHAPRTILGSHRLAQPISCLHPPSDSTE
jgi:hypothetical protein